MVLVFSDEIWDCWCLLVLGLVVIVIIVVLWLM